MRAIIRVLWGISAVLSACAILTWGHLYVRRPWSSLCLGLAILFGVSGAVALGLFIYQSDGHWDILVQPPIWIPLALVAAALFRKRTLSKRD